MPVRFNVELSRLYSGTRLFCLLLLALLSLGIKVGFAQSRLNFAWDELPPLPDSEGFAGMYAGVSNGAVIVAGGANFPDGRPWEGGQKVWYDRIFVLEEPNGQWQVAQQT
ncbi:sodium transporter, partial [candidate division KSB1 bacterium]|nr:sodium transporter [candidate division KSB1 bacterium]